MNPNMLAIGIYQRLYPVAVLLCAAVGGACFASADPVSAVQNFMAIALGIRLDERVRWRWHERSETAASRGWARSRVPTQ